ncbi:MAG: hypothetical protein Q7J34_13570 [Bacteroidales bacterium]|nr:hypothetical protein [Bacteroidales bacterium]
MRIHAYLYLLFSFLFFNQLSAQQISTADPVSYDFSEALVQSDDAPDVPGFISDHYRRLGIRLKSVVRNHQNPAEYYVYGKSKVRSNITEFAGLITIDSINRIEKAGIIYLATYWSFQFSENQTDKHTGCFEGRGEAVFISGNPVFRTSPIINVLKDDNTDRIYYGHWITHDAKLKLPCSWGDFSIRNCGDLDVGKESFSPNPKYYSMGWNEIVDKWW